MSALDDMYFRWKSILTELENEFAFLETEIQKGGTVIDCTNRNAVRAMSFDEAKIFYSSIIESLKYYETVDFFSYFEKFLFDDASQRKRNNKAKCHSDIRKFYKYPKNKQVVAKIIDIWRNTFSESYYDLIFSYIDDARLYRNWIAHGKRSPCKAKGPLAPDEVYTAVNLMIEKISTI